MKGDSAISRLINDGWNVEPEGRRARGLVSVGMTFGDIRSSCFSCGRSCTSGTWDTCEPCGQHHDNCNCQPVPWMARQLAHSALDGYDLTPMREKGYYRGPLSYRLANGSLEGFNDPDDD